MPITIGFSALQRAENSSIEVGSGRRVLKRGEFQCSSASRKFLNGMPCRAGTADRACFSALQRAENSSIVPAT